MVFLLVLLFLRSLENGLSFASRPSLNSLLLASESGGTSSLCVCTLSVRVRACIDETPDFDGLYAALSSA